MTEKNFIQRREAAWKEFSKLIIGSKSDLKKRAVQFISRFREMTQDLNTAKACGYDPAIIERLNMLVNEGNQILYAQHNWTLKEPLRFIRYTFPQKVRSQWRGILAVTLLFYGIGIFFLLLCVRFPDITSELLPAHQLVQYEEMYNPENELFLKPRDTGSDADMFGFYIYHNISIAFRTFACGILAGFGSLLILCFNAGFMGIIEGHLINTGYAKTLYPFIITHSAFELTAIIFCAYGGMLLGYRFFVTNGLTRGASVKKAGQNAFPVIAGSAVMLVIAAAIEAFWSSKHMLPFALRMSAGAAVWILLLLYFLLAGRKKQ
ncbi:MAG: stage II sporulation protein M [Treponema sp.]|nr:stage II sporulation protein M [Treponema sp.]MCL2272856.1 stage II sporulation protein M [Treponema sp.]